LNEQLQKGQGDPLGCPGLFQIYAEYTSKYNQHADAFAGIAKAVVSAKR
jgi:hypothetical protein